MPTNEAIVWIQQTAPRERFAEHLKQQGFLVTREVCTSLDAAQAKAFGTAPGDVWVFEVVINDAIKRVHQLLQAQPWEGHAVTGSRSKFEAMLHTALFFPTANSPLQRTLAVIKPDAVAAGNASAILALIEQHGFKVAASCRGVWSAEQATRFYQEHKDQDFYPDLIQFMTSGESIALALEQPGAVLNWRILLGPSLLRPPGARSDYAPFGAVGTVRGTFGTGVYANAAHGSDSVAAADREVRFWFPHLEPLSTLDTMHPIRLSVLLVTVAFVSKLLRGLSGSL
jgi:nucleoside-diphosphate kinase